MLFERRLREGIREGTITVAFRRWRRPQASAGHRYRTGLDLIDMQAVDVVDPRTITEEDAGRAGYETVAALLADLRGDPELPLYRLAFERLDAPDPRAQLAADATLAPTDVVEIASRLARLDRAASGGPWTHATLDAIRSSPGTRAADLAAQLGWEKGRLKANVRKLKSLGLTISLGTGYRLSPRGEAYLVRGRQANAEDCRPSSA
jgi:hypothetical protein